MFFRVTHQIALWVYKESTRARRGSRCFVLDKRAPPLRRYAGSAFRSFRFCLSALVCPWHKLANKVFLIAKVTSLVRDNMLHKALASYFPNLITALPLYVLFSPCFSISKSTLKLGAVPFCPLNVFSQRRKGLIFIRLHYPPFRSTFALAGGPA